MRGYNHITLAGNLTRDPELRYTTEGTPVAQCGIAVNRMRKQGGELVDDTCFIDLVAFGKVAETFAEYMRRGNPVLVGGRLQLDTWEDKEGQRRNKHKVLFDTCVFLGKTNEAEGPASEDNVYA